MRGIGRVSDAVYDRSVKKILNKKSSRDDHKVVCGRNEGMAAAGSLKLATASASGSCEMAYLAGGLFDLAVNRLMAKGAEPLSASVNVLMPKEAEESLLKALMKSVAASSQAAGLAVCQSDVCAAEGLAMPFVSVTISGLADSLFRPEAAVSDQDIILTGYAGWSGSTFLAEAHRKELTDHFNPRFLAGVAPESFNAAEAVRQAAGAGVRAMCAAGEGGVFSAIWEMAGAAGLGARINLKEIPLRQETVEICDHLNVSPYNLMAEGCLLLAVTHGQKVLGSLAAAGIPAAIIGHLTDDNDRVVINEEETRFLEPYRGGGVII